MVPILLPDDPHALADIGDAGDYQTLWQVVRALRAHDETFAAELDARRSMLSAGAAHLPRQVLVHLPDGYQDGSFLHHLTVRMIEAGSSSWWVGYGHACSYQETHGHLRVASKYVTSSGFNLGQWIANARGLRDRNLLPDERREALDKIEMVWDDLEYRRQILLGHLRVYHAEHGHLRVPQDYITPDGYRLGARVLGLRTGQLAVDDQLRAVLDGLGMVWNRHDARFNDGLAAARRYHAKHGDLDVPQSYIDDTGYKLGNYVEYYRTLGDVPPQRRALLDELGICWGTPRPPRPPRRRREKRASPTPD